MDDLVRFVALLFSWEEQNMIHVFEPASTIRTRELLEKLGKLHSSCRTTATLTNPIPPTTLKATQMVLWATVC